MKYLLSLMLLTFFFTISSNSQVRYFVQAQGNLSLLAKMKNKGEYVNPLLSSPNITYIHTSTSFDKRVGTGVKGGASIPISSKLSIDAMVNVDWVNYRQKNNYEMWGNTETQHTYTQATYNNAGQTFRQNMLTGVSFVFGGDVTFIPNPDMEYKDKDGNTSLITAGINGSLNYKLLPKTKIGLGVGASTLLFAQTFRERIIISGGEMSGNEAYTTIEKDKSKDGFNKLIFWGNLSIEQQLTNKMSVIGGFVQQFNTLYKQYSVVDMKGDKARMRYLSLGLRYYLN